MVSDRAVGMTDDEGSRRVNIFFFQAEDGIRDLTVTGVQTCALPICERTILQLNPQRLEQILEKTGWPSVEPGTLNLSVDNAVLDSLLHSTPIIIEEEIGRAHV